MPFPADPVFLLFLPLSRDWQFWLFYLTVAWLLVWGGHFLLREVSPRYAAQPFPWDRLLGLSLVLFPFIRVTYSFLLSIPDVVTTGTVVPARSPEYWWMAVRRGFFLMFFVPFVGLFLAAGYGEWFVRRPERVRDALRATLAGVGMWPRRSWSRDLATGCGLAVLIFFGYYALHLLLAPFQDLDTGDSSRAFLRITLPLCFALAAMAGITEEFLYRGVLVVRVGGLLPRVPRPIIVLFAAVVFGLAHAGYGTIANMLFPFLLGLLLGFLVLWVGVWPAVIVHGFVNAIIFLSILAARAEPDPLAAPMISALFAFAILFPLIHFGHMLLRDWTRRQGTNATGPEATVTEGASTGALPRRATERSEGRNA